MGQGIPTSCRMLRMVTQGSAIPSTTWLGLPLQIGQGIQTSFQMLGAVNRLTTWFILSLQLGQKYLENVLVCDKGRLTENYRVLVCHNE